MRGNFLYNYKKYFKAIESKQYTSTGKPTDQWKRTGLLETEKGL